MPWARLKPYNPDAGCLKQRFSVGGRCFYGGDGSPGSIPVWYRVSDRQAEYLRKYRQRDGDIHSRHAFDIALTDAEKDRINDEENANRMMALGMVARPQLDRARPREENLSGARGKRVLLSDMADDAADPRMAALQNIEQPAVSNEEPEGAATHEEINTGASDDDDDEVFASDEFSSPKALQEANAAARARVPDMTAAAPDSPEPAPKKSKTAAVPLTTGSGVSGLPAWDGQVKPTDLGGKRGRKK